MELKQFAQNFKEKYPDLKVDEFIDDWSYQDEHGEVFEQTDITYSISNLPGLNDLTLSLEGASEFKTLDSILSKGTYLFKDYLGGKFGNDEVQVVLSLLSKSTLGLRSLGKPIDVTINYQGDQVKVSIEPQFAPQKGPKSEIFFIAKKLEGFRIQRAMATAKLIGFKNISPALLENDIKNIGGVNNFV